ncbi:MAG: chromosome segregation protein SMC [Deltaproteobacteria bacterium]|nr:chromosome segregation protein SMC [Candidatus Zymogenaceae bacterium]
MKLKKLDIIGFKSFIDKVTLAFPDGVTAIVGPNGSGKSNVMDAIKWALGEQSAKMLRGKSMEDVIFNGSREKKPLGMAEVTLTFGNVDGNLPHSFSHYHEITVRRRIYRSGESEYFLNKTPCRLKDITDLFMGTGVGSKAYSMIAQGQIGDLVTARPIDRRSIIEEVAGITKYKAKKIESQRKMEATQTNLLRIGDITGEVKRQMDSLSHQARKAEDYKTLKSDAKRLELIAAARQFVSQSEDLDRKGRTQAQKEQEETLLSTRFSTLEATIEQEKAASMEKEESFSEIQKNFYANETDIKTLEQKIDHLKERIALTQNQNSIFTRDIDELTRFIEENTVRLQETDQQIAECDRDSFSHRQEIEIIEGKIDALAEVIGDLTARWESIRETQMAEASVIARIHNTISSTGKWIERSEQDIDKKRNELSAISEEKTRLAGALSEIQSEKQSKERERDQKTDALSRIGRDVQRHKDREAQLTGEHRRVEESLTRATLRVNSLDEMEKNFEGLAEGTKSIMTGDRQGVLGIFADFIESDERHEKALEGYLGEAVSAVVVKGPRDAKDHIDRLKGSGSGRAVFIPADSAGQSPGHGAESIDGVMGRLVDFVTVKGSGSDILKALLAGAYLTSDLGQAIDIWESKRPDAVLVTLEGEVLTREGLIFGGGSRQQQFSLLRNKREKKALTEELETIRKDLARRDDELQEVRSALAAGQKEEKEIEAELTSLKIGIEKLDGQIVSHQRDEQRLSKAYQTIAAEIERDGAEITRLKQEIEESTAALSEAEKREQELRKTADGAKWALSERQQEMRRLEDQETEIRLLTQTTLDAKQHLISSVEEFKKQIDRARRDQENKGKAVQDSKGEIEDYTLRIAETEQDLFGAIEQSRLIEDGMRDARAQLEAADLKLRDLDEEKKQLAKGLNILREEIQHERDTVKEVVFEQENLTTRILERHQEDLREVHSRYLAEEITDEELKTKLDTAHKKLERFGEVNLMALSEFNTLAERYEFLKTQQTDLVTSLESLTDTIKRIDRKSRERFMTAFEEINEKFKDVFSRLLPGGRARLILTDESDPLESGIDVLAQPVGKRLSSITLLSGGEKALTAIALIFAVFMVKPTPFCMMDEMDAPLDDINTERIIDLLKEISRSSQVILITHNKKTMEMADTLYGLTMEDPGVSKTVSVKLTA